MKKLVTPSAVLVDAVNQVVIKALSPPKPPKPPAPLRPTRGDVLQQNLTPRLPNPPKIGTEHLVPPKPQPTSEIPAAVSTLPSQPHALWHLSNRLRVRPSMRPSPASLRPHRVS